MQPLLRHYQAQYAKDAVRRVKTLLLTEDDEDEHDRR